MNLKIRLTEKKDLAYFKFWTDIANEQERKWYMINDWNMLFSLSEESPDFHLITITSSFSEEEVILLTQRGEIPSLDSSFCKSDEDISDLSYSGETEIESLCRTEENYPWLRGATRTPDGHVVGRDIVADNYLRSYYLSDEAEESIVKKISSETNPYGAEKRLPWKEALSNDDFKSDDDFYWLPVAHFSVYYDAFLNEAEIDAIVSPFMRNNGLGESVLRRIVSSGDEILGVEDIALWSAEIDSSNGAAKRCFENAGFYVDKKNRSSDVGKERYIYKGI